jgi:hypothetical protein
MADPAGCECDIAHLLKFGHFQVLCVSRCLFYPSYVAMNQSLLPTLRCGFLPLFQNRLALSVSSARLQATSLIADFLYMPVTLIPWPYPYLHD